MEDVKLMLYRVKENAEGALGFIAQIEGISRLPGSASPAAEPGSCATADQLREKVFGKAVREGGFSDGTIREMDRLYGVAPAPPAAPEPGAGGRRRRRTRRSKRRCVQHEFRWAGALIGYRCVHCREIDPSPNGQFH